MPQIKHNISHWDYYSKEEDAVLVLWSLHSPGAVAGQFYLSSYYIPCTELGGGRDGVQRHKKYYLSPQKANDLMGNPKVYTSTHTTKQNM